VPVRLGQVGGQGQLLWLRRLQQQPERVAQSTGGSSVRTGWSRSRLDADLLSPRVRVRTSPPGTGDPGHGRYLELPVAHAGRAIVDSEREQSDAQKERGTKGAIGVDGSYIYLALVSNASVIDSAYVLQALGVRDALNLGGGGTSAMWIGGAYTVGPGRLLPNAVLPTKPWTTRFVVATNASRQASRCTSRAA
jgi:hypothetical protein